MFYLYCSKGEDKLVHDKVDLFGGQSLPDSMVCEDVTFKPDIQETGKDGKHVDYHVQVCGDDEESCTNYMEISSPSELDPFSDLSRIYAYDASKYNIVWGNSIMPPISGWKVMKLPSMAPLEVKDEKKYSVEKQVPMLWVGINLMNLENGTASVSDIVGDIKEKMGEKASLIGVILYFSASRGKVTPYLKNGGEIISGIRGSFPKGQEFKFQMYNTADPKNEPILIDVNYTKGAQAFLEEVFDEEYSCVDKGPMGGDVHTIKPRRQSLDDTWTSLEIADEECAAAHKAKVLERIWSWAEGTVKESMVDSKLVYSGYAVHMPGQFHMTFNFTDRLRCWNSDKECKRTIDGVETIIKVF